MSTLKVDTILKRTGTGTITLGQSGDTIAMPSVTLTTALPVAQGGTGGTSFSAAGLANTPACLVTVASTTVFSNDTLTKLAFDTEVYDTASAFASNKFTVPSGQAGKYYINIQADIDSQADTNLDYCLIYIYKNGSDIRRHNYDFRGNFIRRFNTSITSVLDLEVSDYIEGYVYAFDNSGTPRYVAGNSNKNGTQFMMFKLIE